MIRWLKNVGHLCLAVVANIYYRFPSRQITVVGVTGTDGKTTTTSVIYHVLNHAGLKAAMITSVGAYIGKTTYDVGFHVTTPSPFAIQRYLRQAVDSGHTHVVLEITSHALDQHRAWGIHPKVGVLTNITHEHLDYHKTYEAYVRAKVRLLLLSDTCIVNKGDMSYRHVAPYLKHKQTVTYAVHHPAADSTWDAEKIETNLLGDFNKANVLAAWNAVAVLKISKKQFQEALSSFRLPPGRQEIVKANDPHVMIDFAHTPNSLAQILPELKELTKGRLIHVFGSAGERDATKRPEMGKYSSESADIAILTSEDPRSESAEEICKQIRSGFIAGFKDVAKVYQPGKKETKLVYTLINREEAIEKALTLAGKGDTVIFTGKGHETSMNYGQGEVPWSEQEVVRKYLK